MARKKKAVVFDLQGKNVQTIDIVAKDEKVVEKKVDKVDTGKVDKADTKKVDTEKVDKRDTEKVDKIDTKKVDKTETKKINKAEVKESTKKKVFKVDEEKLRKANEYVSQQLTLIEYELTDIKQAILCSLTRLRGMPTAYNVRVKELPNKSKRKNL